MTQLLQASKEGKVGKVESLLNFGKFDLDVPDKADGRTPLMWACRKNNINIARMLVQSGANVDAQDLHGKTALHKPVSDGNIELVELLLNAGANPNIADQSGETCAIKAAKWGRIEVMKRLVKVRADLSRQNKDGRTALQLVESRAMCNVNKREEMLRLLYMIGQELSPDRCVTPTDSPIITSSSPPHAPKKPRASVRRVPTPPSDTSMAPSASIHSPKRYPSPDSTPTRRTMHFKHQRREHDSYGPRKGPRISAASVGSTPVTFVRTPDLSNIGRFTTPMRHSTITPAPTPPDRSQAGGSCRSSRDLFGSRHNPSASKMVDLHQLAGTSLPPHAPSMPPPVPQSLGSIPPSMDHERMSTKSDAVDVSKHVTQQATSMDIDAPQPHPRSQYVGYDGDNAGRCSSTSSQSTPVSPCRVGSIRDVASGAQVVIAHNVCMYQPQIAYANHHARAPCSRLGAIAPIHSPMESGMAPASGHSSAFAQCPVDASNSGGDPTMRRQLTADKRAVQRRSSQGKPARTQWGGVSARGSNYW